MGRKTTLKREHNTHTYHTHVQEISDNIDNIVAAGICTYDMIQLCQVICTRPSLINIMGSGPKDKGWNCGWLSLSRTGIEFCIFLLLLFSHTRIYFSASGQAVGTGVVPSSPRFLPPKFIAHRLSRFPQVHLCTRRSPHEFIRVCTRGDSMNSRS